ncbi:MAG: hypothetical protein C5B43_00950 [Verrucomicrobia bacterium]|nr:MAG: hypothetical protein C5B43_00950 [Verrucomicrobiota bacterium]
MTNWDNKNNNWKREKPFGNGVVVLKVLNDSQDVTTDFLQEIANHKTVDGYSHAFVVRCYGISRESGTGNYVMVMQYMSNGNLRQYLQSNYGKLGLMDKLTLLREITQGLSFIHEVGLVHQDFHSGNILVSEIDCYITDLGLSRPANETSKGKIYGVLPYMAPEVIQGRPYTQASDIYSWGMLAYEMFSCSPPFYEYTHDSILGLRICEGLRPNIDETIMPQLLRNLIARS